MKSKPSMDNAVDAPMGVHIMIDSGWKGQVGHDVSDDEVQALIAELKAAI